MRFYKALKCKQPKVANKHVAALTPFRHRTSRMATGSSTSSSTRSINRRRPNACSSSRMGVGWVTVTVAANMTELWFQRLFNYRGCSFVGAVKCFFFNSFLLTLQESGFLLKIKFSPSFRLDSWKKPRSSVKIQWGRSMPATWQKSGRFFEKQTGMRSCCTKKYDQKT